MIFFWPKTVKNASRLHQMASMSQISWGPRPPACLVRCPKKLLQNLKNYTFLKWWLHFCKGVGWHLCINNPTKIIEKHFILSKPKHLD